MNMRERFKDLTGETPGWSRAWCAFVAGARWVKERMDACDENMTEAELGQVIIELCQEIDSEGNGLAKFAKSLANRPEDN